MTAQEKLHEEQLQRWKDKKKGRNASFGFLMEYWRLTGLSSNAQATLAALFSYTDDAKWVVFPSYRDMETPSLSRSSVGNGINELGGAGHIIRTGKRYDLMPILLRAAELHPVVEVWRLARVRDVRAFIEDASKAGYHEANGLLGALRSAKSSGRTGEDFWNDINPSHSEMRVARSRRGPKSEPSAQHADFINDGDDVDVEDLDHVVERVAAEPT
jgi:hypothetical protein